MTKLALITGASSGIGREFAVQLAALGYDLAIVARREDRLLDLKRELESQYNIKVETIKADLTTAAGLNLVCGKVKTVDLLVNNAGSGVIGEFIKTDLDKELNIIELNVKALYYLSKIYGQRMAAAGSGFIINVSSTAAFGPLPRFAVYAATKSFVDSFSRAISQQLSPYNVSVMVLYPGPTDTEFWEVAGVTDRTTLPPKMMSAADVVKEALKAMVQGKTEHIVGFKNRLSVMLAKILPKKILIRILSKF